jgi:hypothetical protein
MRPERARLKAKLLVNPLLDRKETLRKILGLRDITAQIIGEAAPGHFMDAAFQLCRLRAAISENLNQLPHAALLLEAQRQLAAKAEFQDLQWYWHPHQTHGAYETDLMGWRKDDLLVVVEANTSAKAVGTLKPRIAKAVANLAQLEHPARRFFYCYTESCASWAKSVATSQFPTTEIVIVVLEKELKPQCDN